MRFTRDPAKNAVNVRRHGIAFQDAARIFDGPTVERTDDRYDYGEVRIYAIGLINGIEITVTGEGRTISAIKRMVPAHAHELAALGWDAKTEDLANGGKLIVTASDARQAVKIRALGFMGIMVQGGHHQPHHLMIAKGEFHTH